MQPQPNSILDKHRYINVDHNWWDCTYQYWMEKLKDEYGFYDVEIHFSGFYSQGDGACFTGYTYNKEDTQKFLAQTGLHVKYPAAWALADEIRIRSTQNHSRYSHEHSVDISIDWEEYCYEYGEDLKNAVRDQLREQLRDQFLQFECDVADAARDTMKRIYKDLESEYEYLTSDDMVRETLTINNIGE